MGAAGQSQDSNVTNLRIAEEVLGTPKTIASAIWMPVEPNSYAEFGPQIKTAKREVLTDSRQKRKGSIVGVDASAGFQVDFATKAFYKLMQGFMFADWREKDNLTPTAVAAGSYTVASGGAAFAVGSLLFAEGYTNAANNGLKIVTASTGTSVSVAGAVVEATATGTITRVGVQAASGDVTLTVAGGLATFGSTTLNFTTLGLIPGEWIFGGGDLAAESYATAADRGFYRIKSVAATSLVCDRFPVGAATDAGAGKTVRLFLGHVVKNEATKALQKFRTYQLERQLSATDYEYVTGSGANTIAFGTGVQENVKVDLSFVAMDHETAGAPKAGTRPSLPIDAIFNSATSFSRLTVLSGGASFTGLVTDLKLSINNGIDQQYAIGNSTAAVDLTAGDFEVMGNVEVYFTSNAAIQAVKTNPDCSLDFAMVELVNGNPAGWLFDVPLLQLGDGRAKVEKDKPVKLPLTLEAAGDTVLNHTLLAQRFAYLPAAAL